MQQRKRTAAESLRNAYGSQGTAEETALIPRKLGMTEGALGMTVGR